MAPRQAAASSLQCRHVTRLTAAYLFVAPRLLHAGDGLMAARRSCGSCCLQHMQRLMHFYTRCCAPVQAYDAGDGMLAARLWWLLTVAGHPSALLLEGGWGRWAAEGRPAELYEPCTLKVGGRASQAACNSC